MGRLYKRDRKWGIDYTDAYGNRVRKVVACDKSVAIKLLGDALAAVERVKAGVLHADPREAELPFHKHLAEYQIDLRRRGRAAMYIYTVRRRLTKAAESQGWRSLRDVVRKAVVAWLGGLTAKGLHPKTVNDHHADLSAFLNWCVKTGRLEVNPCAGIEKAANKREKTRRALSSLECQALIDASPPDRAIVYRTLALTGLRRGEAKRLRIGDVHLDAANPYIELPPSITKSGQPEAIPLVPQLAAALRAVKDECEPGDPLFLRIPSMERFREDLRAAGIEETDARGRRVVLHSLRHALATMLAISRVPMAVAQRILRHRDIRLTAQVYTDEGLLPLSAAMEVLPDLSPSATARWPSARADQRAG